MKYRIYTGPTLVQTTAQRLRDAGLTVFLEGTEHVYVQADISLYEMLRYLRGDNGVQVLYHGWSIRDIAPVTRDVPGASAS